MSKSKDLNISVIIPNYNHAKYLDQRIQSVLSQTYTNFEIIILDDCSPDNGASKAVIEKYRENSHVSHIVFNENNSGSTFLQWHKGINMAKGDYIWIAESDDYCDTTLLEKLVDQIKSDKDCCIAYVHTQFVNANGEIIGRVEKARQGKVDNKVVKGVDFVRKYMCIGNPICNASSAIFKKSIAQKIDKGYMNYKGGGDRLFWIEIAEKGNVHIVKEILNYCRRHDMNVTSKRVLDGTNLLEAKRTYDYLIEKKYLSAMRSFIVKGYYLHLISITKFEKNSIREFLKQEWAAPKLSYIQEIIGRLYGTLRNRFEVYL